MTGAPKLKPGTPMSARGKDPNIEARTQRSKWHRIRQWWVRHHMTRDAAGEWADTTGWGNKRERAASVHGPAQGVSRATLREDMALGRHAQNLREEADTKGGREERAAYYGTGEHMGRGTERRTNAAEAERQRQAHEAAERQKYDRPARGLKKGRR